VLVLEEEMNQAMRAFVAARRVIGRVIVPNHPVIGVVAVVVVAAAEVVAAEVAEDDLDPGLVRLLLVVEAAEEATDAALRPDTTGTGTTAGRDEAGRAAPRARRLGAGNVMAREARPLPAAEGNVRAPARPAKAPVTLLPSALAAAVVVKMLAEATRAPEAMSNQRLVII